MIDMVEEEWTGGHFEIEIYLGKISVHTAKNFAKAIWRYRFLNGPFEDRALGIRARLQSAECGEIGYGTARFPDGVDIVCMHSMIRFPDDGNWISQFGFPMASLGKSYRVGDYPFEDGTPTDWIVPVSDWLIALAEHAFRTIPFDMAVIGFEASDEDVPTDVPSGRRWLGYLKRAGMKLEWFPPTETQAPAKIYGVYDQDLKIGPYEWIRLGQSKDPWENRMHRSLDEAVAAGEPLIDITVSYFDGVDGVAATKLLNSLGDDIEIHETPWYDNDQFRIGQITSEGAFRLFGVRFTRVKLAKWNPETQRHEGYHSDIFQWSATEILHWPDVLLGFIKSMGATQPGANDEGQAYIPLFDRV